MKRRLIIILVVIVLLLLWVSTVMAQTGSYAIDWWTVTGSSGQSSGDAYLLSYTIGQPEANQASHGGVFSLVGGYWGAPPTIRLIYLPFIRR